MIYRLLGIYLILCCIPSLGVEFSIKELIRNGLPILSNQYWFFKCYFLLYMISPILNKVIFALDKTEYRQVILLLLSLFCIVPSINIFGDSFGVNSGYSLIWFCVLYLVAGYFKRFQINIKINPIWVYVGMCTLLCMIRFAGDFIGETIHTVAYLQLNYNSPLVFLAALSLLLCCIACNKNYGKMTRIMIETISPLVFGVYLLHDHGVISNILWNHWIKLQDVVHQPLLFGLKIVITLVVLFVCGITVEWIRRKMIKNINTLYSKRNYLLKSREE